MKYQATAHTAAGVVLFEYESEHRAGSEENTADARRALEADGIQAQTITDAHPKK